MTEPARAALRSSLEVPLEARLDEATRRGDPLADAAFARLRELGPLRGDPLAVIESRRAEPAFAALLDQVESTPAWLDREAMRRGRAVFLRSAPLSVAVFVAGSLVEVYAPPNISRVLVRTGRLEHDVVRRLYETAQMVLDVMRPEGVAPGSPGARSVLRVRLMHAMVRAMLAPGWPRDRPVPISQEELALTLTLHSAIIVRSLQRFGVAVSRDDAEAHHLLWREVGRRMGVDDALLARSNDEELALHDRIAARSYAPSDEGRLLAHAIFDGLHLRAPFFAPRSVLAAISRRCLGDELADGFAIPRHVRTGALLSGVARATSLVSPALARSERATELGFAWFERVVRSGLAGRPADFVARRRSS